MGGMKKLAPVVAYAMLLAGSSAHATLLRYEYSGAQRQLARVRMMTERLTKENLLYQLYFADRRHDVVETIHVIDSSLRLLREGAPLLGVPKPPNQAIRDQLAQLEAAWSPVRDSALTNPYNRRQRQFSVRRGKQFDAVLLLFFDDMAARVHEAADQASKLYLEECKKDAYDYCELDRRAGDAHLLSEQVTKDAIFLFADVEPEVTHERLTTRLAALDTALNPPPAARRFIEEAMASTRGEAGEYVTVLQRDIQQAWPPLRRNVELVMDGEAERANLLDLLRIQRELAENLDRMTVVMTRFAFLEEGGQGLLTAE
jgi:hypothetical protein